MDQRSTSSGYLHMLVKREQSWLEVQQKQMEEE